MISNTFSWFHDSGSSIKGKVIYRKISTIITNPIIILFLELMAFLSSDVASLVALLSVGTTTGIRGVQFPTGWLWLLLTSSEKTIKALKPLRKQIIKWKCVSTFCSTTILSHSYQHFPQDIAWKSIREKMTTIFHAILTCLHTIFSWRKVKTQKLSLHDRIREGEVLHMLSVE